MVFQWLKGLGFFEVLVPVVKKNGFLAVKGVWFFQGYWFLVVKKVWFFKGQKWTFKG